VVQLNSGAMYRGDIIKRTSFPDGLVQIATTLPPPFTCMSARLPPSPKVKSHTRPDARPWPRGAVSKHNKSRRNDNNCVYTDHPADPPLVLVTARVNDILNYVCPHCAADDDTLNDRIMQAYKDHNVVGENARILSTPMMSPPGAA
jgi:hypothetical protein